MSTFIGAIFAVIGLGGLKAGAIIFTSNQLSPDSQKLNNGDFIWNYWIVNCAGIFGVFVFYLSPKLQFFEQNNSSPAFFELLALLICLPSRRVLRFVQKHNEFCKFQNLKIVSFNGHLSSLSKFLYKFFTSSKHIIST